MKEITHEEAIKWVRARLASGCSIDEAYKAGLVAIEAIEKQRPMNMREDIGACGVENVCGNCGEVIQHQYSGPQYSYCPYCGQKIDWSDAE